MITAPVPAPVRGDLLSCYTTAVAGLLAAHGLSYHALIGAQLLTSVRHEGGLVEFLHQHTPLCGPASVHGGDLERRSASSAGDAGHAIRDEAKRSGVCVVTGATDHLPWIASGAVEPAPHWFVVCPAGRDRHDLLITDVFAWVNDTGEHEPYESPSDPMTVGRLSFSPEPVSPAAFSRERWALGRPLDRRIPEDARPWKWLEARGFRTEAADDHDHMRKMLQRTALGELTDPSVAAFGWKSGAEALGEIRAYLDAGLDDPSTYVVHNDLWVAARARQHFCVALEVAYRMGLSPAIEALAHWTEGTVVPGWTSLTRVMQYNAMRVERGATARRSVVDELEKLAYLETQLRERLGDILATKARSVRRRTVADSVPDGAGGSGISTDTYRRVLGCLPTGVVAIAGVDGGRPVGITVGSFFSVSLDPPLVGFCVGKGSRSWPRVSGTGIFCASVLADGQADVSLALAQTGEVDKFEQLHWTASPRGLPVIDGSLCWIDCDVMDEHTAGDHSIVIGRVRHLGTAADGAPLVFFSRGYWGLSLA